MDNDGGIFRGGGNERCYTRARAGSEDGFQEEELLADFGWKGERKARGCEGALVGEGEGREL